MCLITNRFLRRIWPEVAECVCVLEGRWDEVVPNPIPKTQSLFTMFRHLTTAGRRVGKACSRHELHCTDPHVQKNGYTNNAAMGVWVGV